jgi:hypothetical protein
LGQITTINKHYGEIAKISGENFNIFNILGLTSREHIHSKFIAMLLNPSGEHGMGDLFLRYFVKTLGEKCKNVDISNSAVVITEKSIGNGQIDIFVSTSRPIIIENKIYAGDQKEQLFRYHKHNQDAVLLYLTLNGHSPDEISIKELKENEDFYCISYSEHILKWLELCRKEAVSKPFLRETINQYIVLVKKLTGQARSKQMTTEIMDVITTNEENFNSYIDMRGLSPENVIRHLHENKIFNQLKNIAKNLNLEFNITGDNGIFKENYGFRFSNKLWKEFDIWFAFGDGLNDLRYGIYNTQKGEFQGDPGTKPMENASWHWTNSAVFAKLFDPNNDVIKEIENRLNNELIPEVKKLVQN